MSQFEVIKDARGFTLAVVLRGPSPVYGIDFGTAEEDQLQLGSMRWPKGHKVAAHVHPPAVRTVGYTVECLVVRSGLVRATVLAEDGKPVAEFELRAGWCCLFLRGGH